MAYKIYNYKGDVLENEVSQEFLDNLINSEDPRYNCFQWDTTIFEGIQEQSPENTEEIHKNTRVYQKIVTE